MNTCPDCGGEMKPLFISSFCPACEERSKLRPAGVDMHGWAVYSEAWAGYGQIRERLYLREEDALYACRYYAGSFPGLRPRPVRLLLGSPLKTRTDNIGGRDCPTLGIIDIPKDAVFLD